VPEDAANPAEGVSGGEQSTVELALRREEDQLVSRLSVVVLLEWMGGGVILPLLPLYLRQRGISPSYVGVTMAAFYFGALCLQYPAGRLVDRIGRRPILIAGLCCYALATLAFLVWTSAVGFIVLRFLQGAAGGAVEVASLALISSAIPIERRGRATSRIYQAQYIGIFAGPVIGALIGVAHMRLLFALTAGLCVAASIPVVTSSVIRHHDVVGGAQREPLVRVVANRALVGAMVLGITLGVITGIYEACWTLLMQAHGATQLQIGLSWAVFSLPYIFLVRTSGWLADHADRRVLAIGGISLSFVMFLSWSHIGNPNLMIAFNVVESVAFSLIVPATQSLLTQGRAPVELGRIQGIYATASTAAIALAAAIGGVLFTIGPGVPFTASAPVVAAAAIAAGIIWRKVPGRVERDPRPGP
jgi:DHA1 family multidrug resistance protein-like MFS transporter